MKIKIGDVVTVKVGWYHSHGPFIVKGYWKYHSRTSGKMVSDKSAFTLSRLDGTDPTLPGYVNVVSKHYLIHDHFLTAVHRAKKQSQVKLGKQRIIS